jgi:hypothetical protein
MIGTVHAHSLIDAAISAICEERCRRALRVYGMSFVVSCLSIWSAGQRVGVSKLLFPTA